MLSHALQPKRPCDVDSPIIMRRLRVIHRFTGPISHWMFRFPNNHGVLTHIQHVVLSDAERT